MASTYYGSWGTGVLGPWAFTTWVAEIEPGSVWNFWVDNIALGYTPSRVMVDSVVTEREGNTLRVRVTMRNPGPVQSGFHLQWSAVQP